MENNIVKVDEDKEGIIRQELGSNNDYIELSSKIRKFRAELSKEEKIARAFVKETRKKS